MPTTSAPASSFVGIGGMFVALFLYGYTAIALPSIVHSVLMPVAWLALFAACCASFTRHPRRAAGTPVIAIALWFAALLLPR